MKTPPNQRRSATAASIAPGPAPVVPERWDPYYRALLAVRERLLKERNGQRAEAAEPLERVSMHMADAASDEAEHDLALGELSAQQDALYEIDEALRRIQNNTYGVCEITGKPIPKSRLRAIPWTRFSREAERQLEREQAVSRPHLGQLASVRKARTVLSVTPEEVEAREAATEDTERLRRRLAEGVPDNQLEESEG